MSYFFQIIMFSSALSVDAFASGLAYGTEGIKIPCIATFIISGICSFVTALGIETGKITFYLLPLGLITFISSTILVLISISKFFEFFIKQCIKKNNTKKEFYIFKFHFFLEIVCNTTKADADNSKILSVKEAFPLALALSFDGFSAGISGGLLGFSSFGVLLSCFVFTIFAIFFGFFSGKKLSDKAKTDLSWLSGVILLILAIQRLI